jgi:acetylornithine deacetylase/succinyl-diaminopimelate desuccinylase-like protein
MKREQLEALFASRQREFVGDWESFLRFESISAIPSYEEGCRACAAWLCKRIRRMGIEAELLETGRKPVVYGERRGDADAPVVLLYGHYDVQPVDPLSLWESPPFKPAWRHGRLYARGAQDNKGQLMYVLHALDQLVRDGGLRATVKLVFEGEEECGSEGLTRALDGWRERLAADVLMVCDTGTVPSGAPTIIAGLRGMAHLTVVLHGPSHDLHSGLHGGVAPNPAQGAAHLVASLFNPDGSVAVEGFYDGVTPPSPDELAAATSVPFDVDRYRQEVGTVPEGGIRGRSVAERLGFFPSLDVNGLHSGYGGEGSKTVLPAEATIKLTTRLVPDQDPAHIVESLKRHVRRHVPAGMTAYFPEEGAAGPGFRIPMASPLVAHARRVLRQLSDQAPVLHWEGASIPVVVDLAQTAGALPLLVGFGQEADRIHAPNESFSLEQYRQGFCYAYSMLEALGEIRPNELRGGECG